MAKDGMSEDNIKNGRVMRLFLKDPRTQWISRTPSEKVERGARQGPMLNVSIAKDLEILQGIAHSQKEEEEKEMPGLDLGQMERAKGCPHTNLDKDNTANPQ